MAVGLPLLFLLPLIVLGGLAAVVFGIVYAIVNKRPGVAMVAVLAPVALLFGAALLGLFWGTRAHVVVQSTGPAQIDWAAGPSMPPMPPMPAMRAAPDIGPNPLSVDPDLAIWAVLAITLVAAVGVMWHFHKRASHSGERRGGWGRTLAAAVLLVLAVNFMFLRVSHVPSPIAQNRAGRASEREEQIRRDVENAQRQAIEAQRKLEAAQDKAASQLIDGKSMQALWEKLNQPRIKLESADHGASLTMGAGANQISIVTPEAGGAKLVVPISEKTPESLARSLARLERMVEQVSAVADKVSDAGTLVGKAMIALNDTMDSPRQPAPHSVAIPATPAPTAPAVQMVLADAEKRATETYSSLKLVSKVHAEPLPAERAEVATDSIAQTRPAWVDEMPKKVGNTQRSVVIAGEYATIEECYEKANELLNQATIDYINQFAGGRAGLDTSLWGPQGIIVKQSSALDRMGIGMDYIRREIAKDEYVETVERSFGPMKKLHTLVEFSPSVDQELRRRWDEYRRQERFAVVGAGAGSVLGLIGLAFGLLKIDTWTRGYYTKRLFFGVPAAIIGLVGLLSLAAG